MRVTWSLLITLILANLDYGTGLLSRNPPSSPPPEYGQSSCDRNPDYVSSVTADNLVATLPSWGDCYEVSFQMFVESFTAGLPSTGGWAEFLRFTTIEGDMGDDMLPGTRIPAVFVNNGGYIGVRSQVGSDANFHQNINIPSKTWVPVEIKQYSEDGVVKYEVLVDGNIVVNTTNNAPRKWENVKVWASGFRYPAANAKIKNLKANGNAIEVSAGEAADLTLTLKLSSPDLFKCEFNVTLDGGTNGLGCGLQTTLSGSANSDQQGGRFVAILPPQHLRSCRIGEIQSRCIRAGEDEANECVPFSGASLETPEEGGFVLLVFPSDEENCFIAPQ